MSQMQLSVCAAGKWQKHPQMAHNMVSREVI